MIKILAIACSLIGLQIGDAIANHDIPQPPKKRACNKIEFYKKCSEISHLRGRDYIVFKWWDKATFCEFDNNPDYSKRICTAVGPSERRMYREGCEINWCAK